MTRGRCQSRPRSLARCVANSGKLFQTRKSHPRWKRFKEIKRGTNCPAAARLLLVCGGNLFCVFCAIEEIGKLSDWVSSVVWFSARVFGKVIPHTQRRELCCYSNRFSRKRPEPGVCLSVHTFMCGLCGLVSLCSSVCVFLHKTIGSHRLGVNTGCRSLDTILNVFSDSLPLTFSPELYLALVFYENV